MKEFGKNKNDEIRKNFLYNLPGVIYMTDDKFFD